MHFLSHFYLRSLLQNCASLLHQAVQERAAVRANVAASTGGASLAAETFERLSANLLRQLLTTEMHERMHRNSADAGKPLGKIPWRFFNA